MKSKMECLGRWPVSGKEARRQKNMILIPPERFLHLIQGKRHHVLVSFFVSNDFIHEGMMTIPAGQYSEPEVHKGDEVVYVLEGNLVMRIYKDKEETSVLQESFEVHENEKFLVPEGVKHQYFNFTDKVIKLIFAVAPDL